MATIELATYKINYDTSEERGEIIQVEKGSCLIMKMRIGELFNLEKGALQSSKCTEGRYSFITAAEEWKTHCDYTHNCEALIFAAAASGSLGRTHYINDKFISSDLCFIMTPKNPDQYPINLKFYHFVFNALKSDIVRQIKSGTSKESINQKNLKKYKLPYFNWDQQSFWVNKLVNTREEIKNLDSEIIYQQTLLKNLRHSILQDAISGKLTAQWRKENPDVEPASVLLKRIKEEKERLVKEKKIPQQKPLHPISDDEIPFELPKRWIWCRLGEISMHNLGKMLDQVKNRGVYQPYLRNLNIRWGNFDLEDLLEMRFEEHETYKYEVKFGDVLICEGGEPGRAAIWRNDIPNMKIQKAIHRVRFFDGVLPELFLCYLQWAAQSRYLDTYFTGAGIKHLTGKNLGLLLLPLAPSQEQKIINDKIEQVRLSYENLESRVTKSQQDVEMLMKLVLIKAFEG